ncbi:hypothetical protein [Pseudomonas aeruginosa]|uniref:hypothetical protein n=1 Tax=Pseudomonas aeruginosa TaxID=287 RepID=UPI00300CDC70
MRDQQTTTNPPEACAQNPDWRQDLSYALIESLMAKPEEQAKAFLKAHLERLPYYERFGLSYENLVLLMEDLFKQLQYTFSFLGIDATWLRQRQLERQVAQTNAYSVLKALQSAVTQLQTHEGPSPALWFTGLARTTRPFVRATALEHALRQALTDKGWSTPQIEDAWPSAGLQPYLQALGLCRQTLAFALDDPSQALDLPTQRAAVLAAHDELIIELRGRLLWESWNSPPADYEWGESAIVPTNSSSPTDATGQVLPATPRGRPPYYLWELVPAPASHRATPDAPLPGHEAAPAHRIWLAIFEQETAPAPAGAPRSSAL